MALFDTDVVIVGAGPTGLLLAGDLAARGVACMIVDRELRGSKLTRAFVVHARTLEQLDARGVADELIDTGATFGTMSLFGNLELDMSLLRSRFPFLLCTPQYNTERVLENRASRLGVEVMRGVEVVGLRQDADGVDVSMRVDGTIHSRRAKFVVGADGVRSVVRDALGVPFLGRSAVDSVMLADVRLRRPPTQELALNTGAEGFCFIAPFGDGRYRIIAWDRRRQLPSSAPVTLQEVSDITRSVMGSDLGLHDVRWLTRFHSDERQVPSYRVGRAFLAGDAAHVHSPAGGQGMNTGLQDAANLGWKLAAAVQGWAPDGLLDTYHAERHPVGSMIVRLSGRLLTTALARTRRDRLARATLPVVVNRFPPAARRLREAISGLAISYSAPRGAHPLVGRRVPDVLLTGESSRLYEALRDGRFVLLAPADEPAATGSLLPARVRHATPRSARLPSMLVRPDGYVAWASTAADPATRVLGLRSALAEWCGLPPESSVTGPVGTRLSG
ncbi:FAD-dependent monooxygenase [Nonomuraea jabiensis]|uniref:2-polyprenyl-6-methoxyphenol hydroxylase-like FAD-dependent oxidoreductase n=1 Tax=Nonomuraea jabiensis TaxID=882448 RepID=A0A7W9GBK3_9ACTN|nr:FAD-dependent monooxygenase [Nonomuraea jabiensis]MBB5780721.1 2-polyprenyl-6-methoxyphenol hydroxylase-like FAD-dependent oxidoreductase [Nonomuraea jabiensis]